MSSLAIVHVPASVTTNRAARWCELAGRLALDAAAASDPVEARRIAFSVQRAVTYALEALTGDAPPEPNPHATRERVRVLRPRRARAALTQGKRVSDRAAE